MTGSSAQTWIRRLGMGLGLAAVGTAAMVRRDLPAEWVASKYVDEASQFVEVDGLRVHYRDQGPRDAPVLLCLHGTFSSLHTWEGWVEQLRDDYRIVRLDLPGFGLTGPHPEGRHGAQDTVHFLAHFLDELGIESCSLAGNSRGGGIAWRFAVDYPDRVEKLVLVDPTGYPLRAPPWIYYLLTLPVARLLARWVTPRTMVAANVYSAYENDAVVDDELIDRYYELLRREGNRGAVLDMAESDLPVDRTDDISDVGVPTLVLWGEADRWIPPADAERFGRDVPDARVITYEGIGHAGMEEAPERTAADVREFLRE